MAGAKVLGTPSAPTEVAPKGYVDSVAKSQQTASYTLVLANAGQVVEVLVTSTANTLTVPPNSSVAFPIDTVIEVMQTGTGKTTIAPGAGVTINAPGAILGLRTQWSSATLRKRGTDLWVLNGDTA